MTMMTMAKAKIGSQVPSRNAETAALAFLSLSTLTSPLAHAFRNRLTADKVSGTQNTTSRFSLARHYPCQRTKYIRDVLVFSLRIRSFGQPIWVKPATGVFLQAFVHTIEI